MRDTLTAPWLGKREPIRQRHMVWQETDRQRKAEAINGPSARTVARRQRRYARVAGYLKTARYR